MSTIAKFTLAEYERMVATGAFSGKDERRLELIQGEIREMSPIGPNHADIVAWLNIWSVTSVAARKLGVRVQSPIALEHVQSEPEPDIVWVGPNRFWSGHPTARDVLLLIEVADSSLNDDRGEKAKLYAAAGIQEYWIVNLIDREIEVRRDPKGESYGSLQTFGPGEFVVPLAVPQARMSIDELFGGAD